MQPYAFVADVLLYDRIRVPTPSPEDRQRWVDQGWQPERQAAFIQELGDRVAPLVWDAEQRARWMHSYTLAQISAAETAPDAFRWTRTQLIESLPRGVTGIDTVAAYPNIDSLCSDTNLERVQDYRVGAGLSSAVLASEFAVPGTDRHPESLDDELRVLRTALDVSNGKEYKRNRRAYWRWLRDLSGGVITDVDAVEEAAEELRDLVDEQQELVRAAKVDTVIRTGFLATTVTIGLITAPAIPVVAIGGAVLSIGQFVWSELRTRQTAPSDDHVRVVALFSQIDVEVREKLFTPCDEWIFGGVGR